MRKVMVVGVVIGMMTSMALAQARGRGSSTLRILNQRVEQISFEEAPFDQVMEWIADYSKINMNIRWQTLEDNGVDRDKPISVNAKNLRLSQILWLIMNEAGGADVKLAYRSSGDLMVLSTAEDLGQEMLVRVYDVSDLLVRIKNFYDAPRITVGQNQGGGGGGGGVGGGGSQNIFGSSNQGSQNDQDDDDDDLVSEEMQQLIDLIRSTVEPDSWALGGGLGTIQAFGNQLVIRNNILVHQLINGPVEGD